MWRAPAPDGGWRAKTVSLDPADGQYDSLLSARDKEMGLPARTMGNAEAAATARQLALITVLRLQRPTSAPYPHLRGR